MDTGTLLKPSPLAPADLDLFNELTQVAAKQFDGHLTVMRFTTNWRVRFGTPEDRSDINRMWAGYTFAEAANAAMAHLRPPTPPQR